MVKLLPWISFLIATAITAVGDVILKTSPTRGRLWLVAGLFSSTVPLWAFTMKSMPLSKLMPLWVCISLVMTELLAMCVGEVISFRIYVACAILIAVAWWIA